MQAWVMGHQLMGALLGQRERRVYGVRRHNGSLYTQKQPKVRVPYV